MLPSRIRGHQGRRADSYLSRSNRFKSVFVMTLFILFFVAEVVTDVVVVDPDRISHFNVFLADKCLIFEIHI